MHPHRRRKKRPNYGVRSVEVSRGQNGFGFTISGQQPCILSCIVNDSPAEAAGLRAGDFLMSVNGMNVSKLPHDAVVNLIAESSGVIKMAIAENYFSESSDDDILNNRSQNINRQRPKYPHTNKSRTPKFAGRRSANFSPGIANKNNYFAQKEFKIPATVSNKENKTKSVTRCTNSDGVKNNDINNVSAMIKPNLEQVRAMKVVRDLKTGAVYEEPLESNHEQCKDNVAAESSNANISDGFLKPLSIDERLEPLCNMIKKISSIECRVIVGYLGTIEMPKQIATSSKLQTVKSCIRKMRQEKRTPSTVLMSILPSCMTLKNSNGGVLAEYSAKRINYVSSSSENDYRFFGLVTSASYPIDVSDFNQPRNHDKDDQTKYDIAISHSCHVFMIDPQIINHQAHIKKAEAFKIKCTIDPVSGMCLEFPNNSEYIVNIIRIMYSLKTPNGLSGKANLDGVSKMSNINRKSCSPRNGNFMRKLNRPKVLEAKPNRGDMHQNVNQVQENQYRNNVQENHQRDINNHQEPDANGNFAANSPQPSNHSEITTTSSNSDSGIGFHNDCQNISDRILVVDFPNPIANNFNMNAPYVGPAFESREVKINPLRENNQRPVGVVGLDIDNNQFLSNTTPVVEGFSGQGRPLNHIDPLLLENIRNEPRSQSLFHAKITKNHAESSHNSNNESALYLDNFNVSKSNPSGVSDKLAVRALPSNINNKNQFVIKSPNFHHHRKHIEYQNVSSAKDEPPHYDLVYSDSYYEENHYEIIYPDENNICNENIDNAKKCSRKSESRHYRNELKDYYGERAVDVPDNDYFTGEVYSANGNSVIGMSCDDMSVTSSKSHEYGRKHKNFSIDDISIYSSKSHDEVKMSKNKPKFLKLQTSVDDILIFGLKKNKENTNPKKEDKDNHVFLHPANVVKLKSKKSKKSSVSKSKTQDQTESKDKSNKKSDGKDTLLKYKLSPKVFGHARPSASVENISKSSSAKQRSSPRNWGHLEGTTSEPDLRECQGLLSSEGGSPFSRWASGSGRAISHRPCRRPGSLASSEHDMHTKQCETDRSASEARTKDAEASGGAASWSVSLERLLADPAGVHAFSAFLQREFSAENIRFWTACERYSKTPLSARSPIASRLFQRHLAEGAPDPVNVDASARQFAKEKLQETPTDLFLPAQKQIFNLMKFDSYPRFLKSDIHKECLMAELQGKPLPYPGDPTLSIVPCEPSSPAPSPNKLKKSLSNAEDRRRKSLLPWHRKLRSKSRDRCCDDNDDDASSIPSRNGENDENDPHGSNSSLLTGWDVARGLNSKHGGSTCSCDSAGICACTSKGALCRVLVPGAAVTSSVVAVSAGGETVRQLLDRLLQKRAIHYLAYEVYLPGSNKPIDINQCSSILAGKEVTVEKRVIFKVDLPNRKVISVKSKTNKALGDVLRPILHKYGVGGASDGINVTLGTTNLELTQPVQVADGQRLQVTLTNNLQNPQENGKTDAEKINASSAVPSLDEITNRVFEELLQGKAERHSNNVEEESIQSDNCSSENSSGIFGRFLRRDDHRSKGVKIKKSTNSSPINQNMSRPVLQSASSEGGSSCCTEEINSQKPLIAKLRAGVKVQNTVGVASVLENTEFGENNKQAQRTRLKEKPTYPVNSEDIYKGKENLKSDKYPYVNDKAANFQPGVMPVAASRNVPQIAPLQITKPSPAPRLSLGQGSPVKQMPKADIDYSPKSCFNSLENTVIENNEHFFGLNSSFHSSSSGETEPCRSRISDPPPLPPKPKVLPIKPSNWGQNIGTQEELLTNMRLQEANLLELKNKLDMDKVKRSAYLDQPSSSLV